MPFQLLDTVTFDRVSNSDASGGLTGASVDCRNIYGVTFLAALGAIATGATATLKVQGSDDNSTFTDLDGVTVAADDADDNGLLLIEIQNPRQRYLRPVVVQGVDTVVVDAVLAMTYRQRNEPVTQSADVIDSLSVYAPDLAS